MNPVNRRKQHQKNALIGVAGFLLLNFPFLGMANKKINLLGFPLLFIYVFIVWAIIILSGFLIVRRMNNPKRKGNE